MTNSPPPKFGPNGAVMNNPAMGERLRAEYRGEEVPRHERRPGTLRGRLVASGVRLLVAGFWLIQAWQNWWMDLLPLTGFCLLMSGGALVRNFWSMGPKEKSFWKIVFRVGALAAFFAGIWWLAPLEPLWARITASGILVASVARTFWHIGRVESWLWLAAWVVAVALLIWVGMPTSSV